jgi:hypothetical protein
MSDAVFLLVVAGLTSVLLILFGWRVARLPGGGLRRAAWRLLECAGLSLSFYALNVAVGFVAVLVLRRVTGEFVSAYVMSDGTLSVLSALQAVAFQWWRAESD